MEGRVHYRQRDVRQGATLLAKYEKGVKLNRSNAVTRQLWIEWLSLAQRFHHEHAFVADCREELAANPTLAKEIRIPAE